VFLGPLPSQGIEYAGTGVPPEPPPSGNNDSQGENNLMRKGDTQ